MYQNVVRQILPVCLILAQLLFLTGTSSAEDFAGLKFGVWLSLTLDTGKHHRIDSAELDSRNVVRVTKERDDIARVMFETHWFYVPKGTSFFWTADAGKWGWGPFVSFEPGSDKAIKAIGAGLMVGFLQKEMTNAEAAEAATKCDTVTSDDAKKKCKTDAEAKTKANNSFNIGIGFVVDPSAQVLADSITENEPLPAGETKIRFKETSQWGFLIMSSYSF